MSKLDQIKALRESRATRAQRRASPRAAPAAKSAKPAARRAKKARSSATITPKVGRPRIEDRDKTLAATKPWEKMKMSRASWYRRQKEAAPAK